MSAVSYKFEVFYMSTQEGDIREFKLYSQQNIIELLKSTGCIAVYQIVTL